MADALEVQPLSHNSPRTRHARIGVPLALALTACSGVAPSDLFVEAPRETSTTTTPVPPPRGIDAGSATSSTPPNSGPTQPPAPPGPPAPVNVADAGPASSEDASTSDASEESGETLVEGGAEAGPGAAACPLPGESPAMIDNGSWPGNSARILPQCGRGGGWYVFNDGASTQSPAVGGPFGPFQTENPPNQVTGYVQTWGTLSETATGTASQPHWGAGLGFDLADDADGTALPYDLQSLGYQGFSFWVRTGPGNEIATIWFGVPTSQTASYADGAYYGYKLSLPAVGVWTKVSVPFASLTQPAWTLATEHVAFDATAVMALQWNFSSGAKEALGFDVAIGDIELW